MADAAFDTLATARLLRESGIEERQAAAITTAIKDGVTGGVATKADLAELRGAMTHDMAELRGAMTHDMAELRGAMTHDMAELRSELKTDMAELRGELKADMAALRGELRTDIADLRTEHRWMKAVGAGIVAALVWMGVQIYDTNARLTGIEQALNRIEAAKPE
ncbi:MAG: DUF1640 domain-containing protein [Boseongicola sp.]|nr:DUF1640 domain-containing protein [Boseongicola sp.]